MQTQVGPGRWLVAWGLGSVAIGAASLLVPLYVVELGGGPVALGVLASTAAVVGAPGAILVGRYADRTGKRRSLLLGALTCLVGSLGVLPLLRSVGPVIVVNAVLWLAWAAVAPVVTMLVVDDVAPTAWNERIGLLNSYQGYGWAAGLVLGTIWTVLGARAISPLLAQQSLFVVCALCGAGGLLGTAHSLPAEVTAEHSRAQTRRIAKLVTATRRPIKGVTVIFAPNRLYWTTRGLDPRRVWRRFTPALRAYLLAALFFFTGSAAFWAPLPALLIGDGYGTGVVFGLYFLSSLAAAVLYEAAGSVSDRYDIRYVQAGALGVRALLLPLVALVGTTLSVGRTLGLTAVVLVVVGATWAVIAVAGTAIATRLAPPSLRGEVLGIYTALAAIAGGIGGVLGGWLAARSYLLAFGVAGGLVVVGALIVGGIHQLSTPETTGSASASSDP